MNVQERINKGRLLGSKMILDSVPITPKSPQSTPKSPQNVSENKAMEFLFVVRDAYPLLADEQVRWLSEKCILQYD